MPASTHAPPGIFDTLRGIAATWVGILKTRVELIAVEVEEQREWLEYLIVWGIATLFCMCFGLLLLTLFIVMCFWEYYRLWVLGGFSVLYLGGGIVLMLLLRSKWKKRPRLFASTVKELAKDHAHLQPGNP